VAALGAIGLASTGFGAAAAALRTSAGRSVLVRAALEWANRAIDGRVTVGSVEGSLLGGLDAREVRVWDPAGQLLARVARLQVRYGLRDLLARRVVLGQLIITAPSVNLIAAPDGPFNYERVLRLDRAGGGGPAPLVAFRDVVITDGTVAIQSPADSSAGRGTIRERRIEGLNARLSYARISSPLPADRALHFEIAHLAAEVSDPALRLEGARGVIDIAGDSLLLDLDEVRLPRSRAAVKGALSWDAGSLRYRLDVRSRSVRLEDLRWIEARFPEGLAVEGEGAIRSQGEDVLAFTGDDMTLVGADGRGGRMHGRLALILGPGDRWSLDSTDVNLDDFDLEYWRPMLDTLPLAGRITGRFRGRGPRESLQVALQWAFRDSLVPNWPRSMLEADGRVAIGVPGEFVFHDFVVRSASLDLGTVRRLVPLGLVGRLDAAGTLNGPWREAEFSGTLRHADAPLPPSSVRGVLRLDARRDTVGLWADWVADSLSLDGLRSSYPALRLSGSFGGDLRLSGYLDSLTLRADLAGPAGTVHASGALVLLAPPWGARSFTARFSDVDLRGFDPSWPPTALHGRLAGTAWLDSGLAPGATLSLRLDSSSVAGTGLDSVWVRLATADSLIRVDTGAAWGPGFVVGSVGSLGLGGSHEGSLEVRLRSDSVESLAPLVRWLRVAGADSVPDSVAGGGIELSLTLTGSLERAASRWRGRLGRLRWGQLYVRGAAAAASLDPGVAAVRLDLDVDSVTWGGLDFSGVEGRIRGLRDSLAWFARARLGTEGSWLAGGRWRREPARGIAVIDSLGVLLPSGAWFLTRGAAIEVSDEAADVGDLKLRSASGRSSVTLAGRFPRAGPGALRLGIEGLPLEDVWALLQLPGTAGGELSGSIDLAGTAAAPEIRGTIGLTNGVFGAFRSPYVAGTVEYRNRLLGGEFGLWRGGQQILELSAELPLDLALNPAGDRRLPGPLSVRAVADGVDLAFIETMIPLARQTSGRLYAEASIGGTWTRPELGGTVRITDGAATFPALGVRHERLNGVLVLSGDTIRVDQLSVRSGEGTLAVSGYVRLEELTRPRLALQLAADRFRAIAARDVVAATVSGDFALQGPVFGATLSGRGSIVQGVVYFTDMITKEIVNLEDPRYEADLADLLYRSGLERRVLREEFQSRFLDRLRIENLTLEMGSEVWMRSSEANFQLAGRVLVGKDGDRYRLDGTLETPRGTYRLPLTTGVTREFAVTRGQLQYFGTPDLNATLDIEARHVVRRPTENVTVTVHIGGTMYAPSLRFTSDIRPPISETEIISYLLFGTSSFEALAAGGGQGRQELLSSTASRVLAGQLERSLIGDFGLPLDYLQIRPGESSPLSGIEVAVGKHLWLLGVSTFLTLSPRVCQNRSVLDPGELGVSIEVRLSRQWLLAGSRDPVGACAVSSQLRGGSPYQLGVDLLWERGR
jgi:translocation and assembly module TamB